MVLIAFKGLTHPDLISHHKKLVKQLGEVHIPSL